MRQKQNLLLKVARFAAPFAALVIAAGSSLAKLPALTAEEKAKAEETKTKNEWADKQALYKLCLAQDKTAQAYRNDSKSAGKPAPTAAPTPPCKDPGAYVSPVTAASEKPIEASVAHSPVGNAASPPSTPTPHAEARK
jgi:hypothetical protein